MGVEGVVERGARPPGGAQPFIELAGVEKTYRMGKLDYPALRGVDLEIGAGDLVAIVGPSGSGKTTILNLVTGIDRPTAGTVTVGGRRIDAMSEEELAIWRGEHVGVVFQFFQLLPTLSALGNAVLPLDFARRGSKRERFGGGFVLVLRVGPGAGGGGAGGPAAAPRPPRLQGGAFRAGPPQPGPG